MEEITLFTAHGQCSRTIEVKKMKGFCFECKKTTDILYFDNSDLEYTPLKFCIDCLNEFHQGKISESSWENDVSDL